MKSFGLASVVTLTIAATWFVSRPVAVPADREVARLQAHFDALDPRLRGADVSQLTPAQREARAQMVGWLREYRDAASFPRNDRFADRRAPFFRDSRGVLCAMAYLIERSGHGGLVDRIARTQNNAYLPALAGDGELVAWLKGAGLTLAEASRIQPVYTPPPSSSETADGPDDYLAASVAVGALSLTTVGFNLGDTPTRGSAWTGLVAGLASAAVAADQMDSDNDETARIAGVNALVGAVTIGSAIYGFFAPTAEPVAFRLTPAVLPAPEAPGVGLAFTARF